MRELTGAELIIMYLGLLDRESFNLAPNCLSQRQAREYDVDI